jgi:hypothetical protein
MQGYNTANAPNYSSSYTYDRNGNLKTLSRAADAGQEMDALQYTYKTKTATNGTPYKTNQLDYVNDTVGDIGLNDLGTQTSGNYQYDAIGQLISDREENIDLIEWRADGKVERITKNNGNQVITFAYDGLGNRISKTVMPDNETTVYSRDAQGNVMAVYKTNQSDITNITADKTITLKEHHIYGSSRLGIEQKSIELAEDGGIEALDSDILLTSATIDAEETVEALNTISVAGNSHTYTITPTGNVVLKAGQEITLKEGFEVSERGKLHAKVEPVTSTLPENTFARLVGDKRYELSNHLGNVLSVVSDRKLLKSNTFVPDVLSYNDYYPFGMLLPKSVRLVFRRDAFTKP